MAAGAPDPTTPACSRPRIARTLSQSDHSAAKPFTIVIGVNSATPRAIDCATSASVNKPVKVISPTIFTSDAIEDPPLRQGATATPAEAITRPGKSRPPAASSRRLALRFRGRSQCDPCKPIAMGVLRASVRPRAPQATLGARTSTFASSPVSARRSAARANRSTWVLA